MPKRDPFASLNERGAGRLSLPFLPTLVTAIVLGAGSLLCREPAAVAPPASVAPAASVEPRAFHAAAPVEAALARPPAVVAFAQFPPSLALAAAEPQARIASPHPAARVAAAGPLRRPCTAPRCAEGPPRRPEALGELRPAQIANGQGEAGQVTNRQAERAEAESGLLPDLALPFAPAVRVAGEAAAFVRSGAAALGGSVAGSVALLTDRLD